MPKSKQEDRSKSVAEINSSNQTRLFESTAHAAHAFTELPEIQRARELLAFYLGDVCRRTSAPLIDRQEQIAVGFELRQRGSPVKPWIALAEVTRPVDPAGAHEDAREPRTLTAKSVALAFCRGVWSGRVQQKIGAKRSLSWLPCPLDAARPLDLTLGPPRAGLLVTL